MHIERRAQRKTIPRKHDEGQLGQERDKTKSTYFPGKSEWRRRDTGDKYKNNPLGPNSIRIMKKKERPLKWTWKKWR